MSARARKHRESFKKYRANLRKEAKAERERPKTYVYTYGAIGIPGARKKVVSAPYKVATMQKFTRKTIVPKKSPNEPNLVPLPDLVEKMFKNAKIIA